MFEIESKKDCSSDSLKIEYGGIICGFIKLHFKKKNYFCEITFDQLVNDPIPQLVNFFLQVRNGEDCEEHFSDEWFRVPQLSMAAHQNGGTIFFVLKIYKYEHITETDVIFEEIYFRDEFETMLKKIFDDLLHDEKFPYIYPMYHRYDDKQMDEVYELACQMANNIPNLTDEERNDKEDKFLLQMMRYGKIKPDDCDAVFIEKYKKMLANYIVPENWLLSLRGRLARWKELDFMKM